MDYDLIYNQTTNLNTDIKENKLSIEELKTKYSYLNTNLKTVFEATINRKLDLNMLKFLIEKAKELKKNKISIDEANEKVGEKIYTTFLEPLKNKEK